MCGIAGSVEPASERRSRLIRAMCSAIVHRGPDDEGLHEDQDVALGMRRLSIIDVAGGHQPVYNETGRIAVVFNGEIYNYPELRQSLLAKGHALHTESDSECIPHLYEEYGPRFVEHLRGMFAIALWDADRRRLVLARDRLGKKPLFYSHVGDRLLFGSELKTILTDGRVEREIDPVALSHYLTYQYVPHPWSIYRSVRKLPPAHTLVFEGGRVTIERYWEPQYRPAGQPDTRTEAELAEELRARVEDSVKVRLMSERPLGAFLSGGLDSSAIVAAMSRVGSGTPRTFSIGFEEQAFNELPYARKVAERYATEHHEFVVRAEQADILPKLARMFDEPYADSSALPSLFLAQLTRDQVVVALNGDGGDEALGGYQRYLLLQKFESYSRVAALRPAFRLAHAGSAQLSRLTGRGDRIRRGFARLADTPARRYAGFVSYFDNGAKQALVTPEFVRATGGVDSYGIVEELWERHRHTDPVNRILAVDTHSYLPGDLLPKVDITTMAVSLEARSPLLDHTFIDWAAGLGGEWKVRDGETKYLFKKALIPWLGEEIIYRDKKGFGIPLAEWLRGPLREWVEDTMHASRAVGLGWFEPAAIQRLLDEHAAGGQHGPRLWALLMLEMWFREVHDHPAEVPA